MTCSEPPFLTSDVPGVGGQLRQRDTDFFVEEIPLYEPAGQGEHIYLFVEKRGLSTSQLVHLIARHFGVRPSAVGYAGMKDKHAVTRQIISVHTPRRTHADFPMLENERVTVLNASMHANKLRLGHLRGNRFVVRIRGVDMSKAVPALRVLRTLETMGVPNFAGEQRFGSRQNNHRLGLALIRKEWRPLLDELLGPDPAFPHINADARALYAQRQFSQALDAFPPACRHERAALHVLETGGSEEKAVRAVDILQRRFWFTALQSSIFNSLLAERIQSGTLGALRAGDIAAKAENSAMFRVTADDENNPELAGRLARFEVAPTGPLWGARMMRAEGPAGEAERRALHNAGLSEDDLLEAERQLGDSMGGARRAYRVPIRDSSVEGGVDEHGHFVQVAFSLPPGAFATVVLREIMKNPGTLWTDSASPAAASAAEEAAE